MKKSYSYSDAQYLRELFSKMDAQATEARRVVGLLIDHSASYSMEDKFLDIRNALTEAETRIGSIRRELDLLESLEDSTLKKLVG
jgi:hypothetical protein